MVLKIENKHTYFTRDERCRIQVMFVCLLKVLLAITIHRIDKSFACFFHDRICHVYCLRVRLMLSTLSRSSPVISALDKERNIIGYDKV